MRKNARLSALFGCALMAVGCYGVYDPNPDLNSPEAIAQAELDFPSAVQGTPVGCEDLNGYSNVKLTIPESLSVGGKDADGNPTEPVKIPAYDVSVSVEFSVPEGDPTACVLNEKVPDGALPKIGRTAPVYYAVRQGDTVYLRLWALSPWAKGTATAAVGK